MKITKDQVVELFKLYLNTFQSEFEEICEGITLTDEQFINTKFEILTDTDAKKLYADGFSLYSSFFRKKNLIQVPYYDSKPLRDNVNFIAIAREWQATANKFNASKALDQFCSGVAREHQTVYGLLHTYCQDFLEKFAEGLLYAVENGAFPIYCSAFLKDLWVDIIHTISEPFQSFREFVPSITIRRPKIEDYAKCQKLNNIVSCGGFNLLQIKICMQTAIIEFFWYDKEPIEFTPQSSHLNVSIKFKLFQQSLETIFLLLGNASVRMTETRYNFTCSTGLNSIFDSSPGRCIQVDNLDKKLKWVGQLALPLLMNEIKGNEIISALKYYQDSLFRSLGADSRISLSISGLEALYLHENAQSEITLRLSLRVARLLSYMEFDPIEVGENIKKAYAIRSCHVHGSKVKKIEPGIVTELSDKIDEYLRLSILAFQHCLNSNHSLQEVNGALHNASFSFSVREAISQCLVEVKEALKP